MDKLTIRYKMCGEFTKDKRTEKNIDDAKKELIEMSNKKDLEWALVFDEKGLVKSCVEKGEIK